MTLHLSHALRPSRVALGVQWLVLMVFMFGAIVSSIGGMNSHGLAAIVAPLHVTPFSSDTSHVHVHVHGDEDIGVVDQSAGTDHPHHHGADHSHDNGHALSAAWKSSTPQLSGWCGRVRPWIEMIQASRLERPPMG